MAQIDVDNMEKTLAYFINARRDAARGLANRIDKGTSTSTDWEIADKFSKLQHGVEAARAALSDENTDPAYLNEISEKLMNI